MTTKVERKKVHINNAIKITIERQNDLIHVILASMINKKKMSQSKVSLDSTIQF